MKQYGLIGYPLHHSFSEQYFTAKWAREGITNARYGLFPLPDIEQLPQLVYNTPHLSGLNVTLPHKQRIIPLLSALSDEAQSIGAVNCLAIVEGKLIGYNTDIKGFSDTLLPLLQPYHQQAWVLGTGGAAKAVCYVLRQVGLPYRLVSRCPTDGQIGYDDWNSHAMPSGGIIINTTPLGMYPHHDTCPPIPYQVLTPQYLCYDLVYNPSPTLFLKKAAAQGAVCQDGLAMLYRQADCADAIWRTVNMANWRIGD